MRLLDFRLFQDIFSYPTRAHGKTVNYYWLVLTSSWALRALTNSSARLPKKRRLGKSNDPTWKRKSKKTQQKTTRNPQNSVQRRSEIKGFLFALITEAKDKWSFLHQISCFQQMSWKRGDDGVMCKWWWANRKANERSFVFVHKNNSDDAPWNWTRPTDQCEAKEHLHWNLESTGLKGKDNENFTLESWTFERFG